MHLWHQKPYLVQHVMNEVNGTVFVLRNKTTKKILKHVEFSNTGTYITYNEDDSPISAGIFFKEETIKSIFTQALQQKSYFDRQDTLNKAPEKMSPQTQERQKERLDKFNEAYQNLIDLEIVYIDLAGKTSASELKEINKDKLINLDKALAEVERNEKIKYAASENLKEIFYSPCHSYFPIDDALVYLNKLCKSGQVGYLVVFDARSVLTDEMDILYPPSLFNSSFEQDMRSMDERKNILANYYKTIFKGEVEVLNIPTSGYGSFKEKNFLLHFKELSDITYLKLSLPPVMSIKVNLSIVDLRKIQELKDTIISVHPEFRQFSL